MEKYVLIIWALSVVLIAGGLAWVAFKKQPKNEWYTPSKKDNPVRRFR